MPEKMKILIAYDGSSCADAALDDLRYAGLPRVAEALIMSVADVFLQPPSSQEAAFPARVPVAVQQAGPGPRTLWKKHALALTSAGPSAHILSCLGRARRGMCRFPCLGGDQTGRYLAARCGRGGVTRPLCHGAYAVGERVTKGPHRCPLFGTGGAQPPPD